MGGDRICETERDAEVPELRRGGNMAEPSKDRWAEKDSLLKARVHHGIFPAGRET